MQQPDFLPVSRAECSALGWSELDVVIVSGDAYVDHPAFGAALLGRVLVAHGFSVGIIAQPRGDRDDDFLALGRPRLFFGVTAGNMDSMVNHYTAQRKLRSDDAFSPHGKAGLRPDRATLVYTQHLRRLFKGVPVVLGGIEASMRRIPHYDFWSDKVRNSILFDAKADLLVYGMAEKTIVAVAQHLKRIKGSGVRVQEGTTTSGNEAARTISNLPGTVVAVQEPDIDSFAMMPSWEESRSPEGFLEMSRLFHSQYRTTTLFQPFAGRYLKHNTPAPPMTTAELDAVYALPFARAPHPRYKNAVIPAFVQIRDSVTAHRGCFGGCAFCALGYHQGRTIQSRSIESVKDEIMRMAQAPGFTGTVSDVGGPSANMYGMTCRKEGEGSGFRVQGSGFRAQGSGKGDPLVPRCDRQSCLYPDICPNLDASHEEVRRLLAECRRVPGVTHVFVSSGVRLDLALQADDYIRDLARHHTSGRLKVAPEHVSHHALDRMGKPDIAAFDRFVARFACHSKAAGKSQQVIPYLMVGHPGTTPEDALALHAYLERHHIRVEQVQEFTPTPMTISACMYYTGREFATGDPIHVPKGREVRLQKALAQWFMPGNRKLVAEARKKWSDCGAPCQGYAQDAALSPPRARIARARTVCGS